MSETNSKKSIISGNSEALSLLKKRFPTYLIKQRSAGFGKMLDYISQDQCIERLNEVFGVNWSVAYDVIDYIDLPVVVNEYSEEEKKKIKKDAIHKFVIVKASISYTDENGNIQTKDGIGAEDIQKAGMDLDATVKSACSYAIKKAATTLGVGLYIYDEEERNNIESQRAANKNPPSIEERETIRKLCGSLNEIDQKVYECFEGKLVSHKDLNRTNVEGFITWLQQGK